MLIYEVVDVTNEECYYTMGVFSTIGAAIEAVESTPPNDLPSDGYTDEGICVEIRERQTGLKNGYGKRVWYREWEVNDDDEYVVVEDVVAA